MGRFVVAQLKSCKNSTGFIITGIHRLAAIPKNLIFVQFCRNRIFCRRIASGELAFIQGFQWATLVFKFRHNSAAARTKIYSSRMQRTPRRDLKLQGSLNPNLSNFGEKSDARQYSGRAVNKDWKCPFHVQAQNTDEEEVLFGQHY